MDLVEPAGDEVLADRLLVGLGEERLDVAVGGRRDPGEDRVRIVVAGLDALEVEDRPARRDAPAHRPIRGSTTASIADARIGIARSMPQNVWAEVDVGRLDRVGARGERHVLEAVGRPDRVHLRVEDAPLRGARRLGSRGRAGSFDHGAAVCPRPATPVGRAPADRRAGRRGSARTRALDPDRTGRRDPLDRRPVARPDDLLGASSRACPRGAVVLGREARLGIGIGARTAKTAAVMIAVHGRLVELVDQIEVVEAPRCRRRRSRSPRRALAARPAPPARPARASRTRTATGRAGSDRERDG